MQSSGADDDRPQSHPQAWQSVGRSGVDGKVGVETNGGSKGGPRKRAGGRGGGRGSLADGGGGGVASVGGEGR